MGAAADQVNSIIQNAVNQEQFLVGEAVSLAALAVNTAATLIGRERVTPEAAFLTPERIPEVAMVDPGVFETSFERPSTTLTVPDFRDPMNIDVPQLPQEPAALDTSELFQYPRPTFNVPNIVGDIPDVNTTFVFPDAPLVTFPDAPVPITLNMPTVAHVALPSFDAVFQGTQPTAPDAATQMKVEYAALIPQMKAIIDQATDEFIAVRTPQHQAGLATLEARIAERIAGGTAANEVWEQALYDRLRARIYKETAGSIEEAQVAASKRGFALPQATIAAMLSQLGSAVTDRLATSATEVAVERHKLELTFLQFIMELSSTLRQSVLSSMLQHAGVMAQLNGQSVQMAQAIASTLVELYNAAIQLYNANIQRYRMEADIFEARLRAAMAELEEAKVLLEIEQTKAQVSQIEVDIYTKRIMAVSERVRIYIAELDSVKTRAEIEKLKIDVFGEIVAAQNGLVQMKTAEFGAYRAAIDGDVAQVTAHAETVRAYSTTVEAKKTVVDAQVAANTAIAQFNNAQQARYAVTAEQVKTELQVALASFTTSADAYKTRLEQFRMAGDLRSKNAEISLREFTATVDATMRMFEGKLRQATSMNELSMQHVKMLSDVATSTSSVMGGVASSAISGLNTMATIAENQLVYTT